jgi:arylsulfatase A-like enzyme
MAESTEPYSRRTFLRSGACAITASALPGHLAALAAQAGPAHKRPNILFLLADDQGYGDLSCHGNPYLTTPNIDALAKQSTELTRFYVSPVCSPTRSSLLTGRYSLRVGVHGVTGGYETMDAGVTTVATAFRAAGYRTALFGKWHLGSVYPCVPDAQGFEEFIGFRQGHEITYWDTMLERDGAPYRLKGFITDALTDEGTRYMSERKDEPFYLYMAYNVPHTPSEAPRELFDKYRVMPGVNEYDASIYAMMENLDNNVGRILAHLDHLGIADNTIVVYASDNGPNGVRYTSNFAGHKNTVDEGGVRVPFFIRWPGHIAADTKLNDMAAHIDWYPTATALAGIPRAPGAPIDGEDISPLLLQHKPLADRMFFTHRDQKDQVRLVDDNAVRTNQWLLVRRKQLYDLLADPYQKQDLSEQHPEVVHKLADAYDAWFRDVTRGHSYERPVLDVGYAEENPSILQATEAYFSGGLKYWGKEGWSWDWITGWTSLVDEIHWKIRVHRAGRYQIGVRYLCSEAEIGSRIAIHVGRAGREAVVKDPTSITPIPNLDLVPRKEVPMMPWNLLELGTFSLAAGETDVTLRALQIARNTVADVKDLVIRNLDSPPTGEVYAS